MSNYYYLIASLPDLALEDNKLNFTISTFKEELYTQLTGKDKKIIDLFYLKFDNRNVLRLLNDKEAETDPNGLYSSEFLLQVIADIKEGGKILRADFPSYLSTFIAEYFEAEVPLTGVDLENRLTSLYFEYGMQCSNAFATSWFEFNLTVNNVLLALIARRYKLEVAESIVGNTPITEALSTSSARDFGISSELTFFDELVKISEIDDLLEREKKIDQMKWGWIEEATFFNYFSVERLFAFLLQIEMIERWLSLDKNKGRELFRNIVDILKDEVRIPEEFK